MKLRNVSIFKPRRRRKAHHPWLIAYGTGSNRKVVTASTVYEDTLELALKLSRESQRADMGLSDPTVGRTEIERRRPLVEHFREWEKNMIASGKTAKHARQLSTYATQSLSDAHTIDAVVSSRVQQRIADASGGKNRRAYAVRTFVRWGVQDGRWTQECLDRLHLSKLPKGSRRTRRVLPVQELTKLINTTADSSKVICGLDGQTRSLMYLFMVTTGLRYGETTRLRARDLRQHGFLLPAAAAKNRKEAMIRLPEPILVALRERVALMKPDDAVFPVWTNGWKMMDSDLADAGIPRKTNDGIFDFHSLRHECVTILASASVPLKVIQKHMRLGSVELTMETYGHMFEEDRRLAMRALENFDKVVQRGDQRADGEKPDAEWSHRELNPDLLNAIPSSAILLVIADNTLLYNKHGRKVAPRHAQRLLRKMFTRATARGRR